MTKIAWHGDAVLSEAKRKAWKRVQQAGRYLKARIQHNVDIATAARGPSTSGEYPHKVTGTLQKSIFTRKREDSVAIDVGTRKVSYAIKHEIGVRPYIRRTFYEQQGTIRDILVGRKTWTIDDIRREAAAMKERHQEQKRVIQEKKAIAKETKREKKRAKSARIKAERAVKKAKAKAAIDKRLAKMPKEKRKAYRQAQKHISQQKGRQRRMNRGKGTPPTP